MTDTLTPFKELANLYSEGFGILAGMTDQAIKRTLSERQVTRDGRHNPPVFHGCVREAILMDKVGLAALEEHGMTVLGGVSDSLNVRLAGRTGVITLTHQPRKLYAESFSLGDGLFPANAGRPCLFYAKSFAGLRKFSLVETTTPKDDFFIHGVEVIDQIEIAPVTVIESIVADPETANDHDNLDDLFAEDSETEKSTENDADDYNPGEASAV
ncbi:hypothetical protein C3B59_09460 [Cryobacterium zongtaii]|uniref:Uncharacterized protein n=1 Tax=Cryobacterium zongtaii TaxID=1259217 RepID=A0A2S3ZEI4_9MICO|nr:hypothetical protein [Cryobacterium zongtaii]POH64933.1 hypothetical protein C3B59_09460 [Cryobacterium zongtaii]